MTISPDALIVLIATWGAIQVTRHTLAHRKATAAAAAKAAKETTP